MCFYRSMRHPNKIAGKLYCYPSMFEAKQVTQDTKSCQLFYIAVVSEAMKAHIDYAQAKLS